MNYRELKAKLTDLEVDITAVQAEGEILTEARIDSSKPGGTTARGQPGTQYRLRIKGQKAHYLEASEVASRDSKGQTIKAARARSTASPGPVRSISSDSRSTGAGIAKVNWARRVVM